MSTMTTDKIEKQILLQAPRTRVWRALTDSKEFSTWFKATITQPFKPGTRVSATLNCGGHDPLAVDFDIERMDPETHFSYRWHPTPDAGMKSDEPTTLVEFTLSDVDGGTLLKVVESGFDRLPVERRAAALKGNEGGWTKQMVAIEAYLDGASAR
jgi:uncharacterized protein YndB with AHSA1/START domain